MVETVKRKYTAAEKKFNLIGFLCGLTSLLFVSTPFGRVSMFDFSCYFLCILLVGQWSKLQKKEVSVILLGLLWFLFACISNYVRDEPFQVALKNNMIVLNMTCMMVTLFLLQKKTKDFFVWFMIGNAISGVISLYVFQNGALLWYAESSGYLSGSIAEFLQEKQYYVLYQQLFFNAILLPLAIYTSVPTSIIINSVLVSAMVLISVGSRSSFGTSLLAVGTGTLRLLAYPFLKLLMKNFLLTLFVGCLAYIAIFSVYKYCAKAGVLGEGEMVKYQIQFEDRGAGFFGGRSELLFLIPFLMESPILGAGATEVDRWGIVLPVLEKYNMLPDIDDGFDYSVLPGHSCLVGAWIAHGLGGGAFWLYVFFLFVKMLRFGLDRFKREYILYFLIYMGNIWNLLFSGFGMNRGALAMGIVFAIAVLGQERKRQVIQERNAAYVNP